MTTVIPQGELRNNIGAILRRAERGERFTVTVAGRPAAELGPLSGGRALAPPGALNRILTENPPDGDLAEDLRRWRREEEEASREPWAD